MSMMPAPPEGQNSKFLPPSLDRCDAILKDPATLWRLLENCPAGIVFYKGSELRVEFMNASCEAYCGVNNVLGKNFREAFPELSETQIWEDHFKVYESGKEISRKSVPLTRCFGIDIQETKYFDVVLQPMFDRENNVDGVLTYYFDVTNQVMASRHISESEKYFRSLVDTAPAIFWVTDVHGTITYLSRKWFEYTGCTPNHNVELGWLEAIHPDDRVLAKTVFCNAFRNFEPFNMTYRLQRENGTYGWTVDICNPRFDADGNFLGFVGTVLDISERKKAEELLRESEERLRLALQATRTGFWDRNVITGEVIWSEEMRVDWNFPEWKLSGHIDEIMAKVHPDDIKLIDESIRVSQNTGAEYSVEYRIFPRPGELTWILARGLAHFDADGNAVRMMGTTVNITAERLARDELLKNQQAVLKSEQRLRQFVEQSPYPVAMFDKDMHYLYASATWFRHQKIDAEEARGKSHYDIFPNLPEAWKATHRRCLAGATERSPEEAVMGKDGRVEWIRWEVRPWHDNDGEIGGILLFTEDISERKNAEDQLKAAKASSEAANAAKSIFLANISHEIRTPLGAIQGFTELLSQPGLTKEDLDHYVSVIDRNSKQVIRIIDDILDLSKVEAGKMAIEKINFSLPALLSDFSSLMSFRAIENGITFKIVEATPLPSIINSDPTRIRQILSNIVGNAIKFTARGYVRLIVSSKDGILEFRVEDTGRGISNDQLEKLFQPFEQGDPSTTRRFGGTGLGLILTRVLCRALGGDFYLEKSEVGKGSIFFGSITIVNARDARVPEIAAENQLPPQSSENLSHDNSEKELAGLHVLLVEDSPDIQALLKIFLGKAGADIDIASDGHTGVEYALSHPYDVVLMDIQMPRMDGHEATRLLRSQGYDRPIVALTAHAMKEEREKCKKSGFSDYLSKPIQRKDLIDSLQKIPRIQH